MSSLESLVLFQVCNVIIGFFGVVRVFDVIIVDGVVKFDASFDGVIQVFDLAVGVVVSLRVFMEYLELLL